MGLKQHIRHVPDFPKAGILFYDITTLLRDPIGFKATIELLSTPYMDQGIDAVVGIESRGFILGAAVAEARGNATQQAAPRRRLLDAEKTELASGLPEYERHRDDIAGALAAARSKP